jgi:HPr kinase/phosphorylase
LLLRLLDRGFLLVADDQLLIEDGLASAPPALAGLLEVRGLGIFRIAHLAAARLRLAVRLAPQPERLPEPVIHAPTGLPLVTIDPASPSAAARVSLALDAVLGRIGQIAGAMPA